MPQKGMGVQVPPRTRSYVRGIQWSGLDYYRSFSWLVQESYTKLAVDLGFVDQICLVKHAHDVLQRFDHAGDLLSRHAPLLGIAGPGFGEGALGLDFGHPSGDDRGVGAGFERSAMLAELGVAVGYLLACLVGCLVVLAGVLSLVEFRDGAWQQGGAELGGEPSVQVRDELVFARLAWACSKVMVSMMASWAG